MLINLDKLLKKALVFVSTGVLAACTPVDSQLNKSIIIDGSSTVYPITKAVAD
jgi:phosphate transport system substrate-binding protein